MRFLTKAIQGIRQTGAAITPRVAGVAAGIGLGGYGAVKLGQYQAEKFREGRFSRHSYRNFVDAMNERAASEKLYGYNHPGFGFGIYDKPYAENLTAKRVSFEAQRQRGL
jgi:hypothetical protein